MMKQINMMQTGMSAASLQPAPNARPDQSPNPQSSRLRYWSRRVFLPALTAIGMLGASAVQAQTPEEKSILYNSEDLKHYATSELNGTDGYAMAGTVFGYAGTTGDNGVHLLVYDMAGNLLTSHVYNDPDYDERTVGVHYLNPNDVAIVSSRVAINGIVDASGIQVIRVDGIFGTQLSTHVIQPPMASGQDYWPMGSMMVPGDALYICGYVTPTVPPGTYPDFTVNKEAFVLRYDLAANLVINMQTYDWPSGGFDYDIAHRMRMMGNGNIWVGGMCNGNGSQQAMMNMEIDPSLVLIQDEPIVEVSTAGMLASSFDFWEGVTAAGNIESYVFGNYCIDVNAPQMDLYPTFVNITSVDPVTLVPAPGTANQAVMNQFDNTWGTNVINGNSPSEVVLSGFQTNYACGPQILPTSHDNVNPYLGELILTTTGGNISVGTNYWMIMESIVGTGSYAFDPNSYYNLGGAPSNLAWGPVTTVRDMLGPTNDIVLNAPVWNQPIGNRLNLKTIRTDQNGNTPCGTSQCFPVFTGAQVVSTGMSAATTGTSWFEQMLLIPDAPLPVDALLDCAATGYYKGVNSKLKGLTGNSALSVSVYPNPTQGVISLQFDGPIEDTDAIHVSIADVTGKHIAVLYNGAKSGLSDQLQLPELAAGTYWLTVSHNATKLNTLSVVVR